MHIVAGRVGPEPTTAVREQGVKAVLAALAKESGWEVRLDPDGQGTAYIPVESLPFEAALWSVARQIGRVPVRVFAIRPRDAGQALPDRAKLPADLPKVTVKLVTPVPAGAAIEMLRQAVPGGRGQHPCPPWVDIETPKDLKGQVTIDAQDTPLPEVLDALCRQLGMTWTLSYRLRPAPAAPPSIGGPGGPGDPEAEAARQWLEQWAAMPPEQQAAISRRQVGALLRADPAARTGLVQSADAGLRRLGLGFQGLRGPDRTAGAAVLLGYAEGFLSQFRQLTPEQRQAVLPAMQAAQWVLNVSRVPAQPPR